MKIFQTSNNELVEKTTTFIQEYTDSDYISIKTSGSTGIPKEYNVEKGRFICSAIRTCDFFNLKEGDKSFLCISPEYIGGKMMIIRSDVRNLELHIGNLSGFPFENEEEFNFAAFVPLQIKCIIEKDINCLKRIQNIIIGGGVLNPELEKILVENNINAYITFGMTETLSHIALRKVGESEYHLLKGVRISSDKEKRLIIYDQEITQVEALQTNDIVDITGERTFIWKGRYDNVINSGGIKLYPEEIEKKLTPLIQEFFFISKVRDPKFGEKVVLIIESHDKVNYNFDTVLSKYEKPKSVYNIDQFEYTETNKINRNKTLSKLKLER